MLGKLIAVVHRQRVDLAFAITRRTDEYVGDMIGVLGEDRLDASETTFSID
jgi:hypothetical protein